MTFLSIQIFRAIAANAVVLGHLVGIEGKYAPAYALLPAWAGLAGSIGVHFFFVISGFVMALVAPNSSWTGFLLARVIRIYPVYWFYTSLIIVIWVFAPGLIGASFPWPESLLKSYLLWPDASAPLLTVGWSLVFEMYFYVVMALIVAFACPLYVALIIWTVALSLANLLVAPATPLAALVTSPLAFEFIAGAAVSLMITRGMTAWGLTSLVAGVALVVVGGIAFIAGAHYDKGLASVILLGLPFAVVLYGAAALESRGRWPDWRGAVALGDASYSTYLSHSFVLSALGRLFQVCPVQGWIVQGVFLLTCFAVANAVGRLSFLTLERPSSRHLRQWLRLPARRGLASQHLKSQGRLA